MTAPAVFTRLAPDRLLHDMVWSLADSALISLTNFLIMVLVAQAISTPAFGQFVVVYMAVLFATGLQTSLVTRPHNVIGATLDDAEYARLTGTLLTAQLGLALVVSGAIGVAALAATMLDAGYAPLLVAVVPAAFALQMQEFFRRCEYTRARPRRALGIDVVGYGGQLLLIGGLAWFGRLDGVSVLYGIAGAAAASAAYGFVRLRADLGAFSADSLRRSWGVGKWLTAENLGQWLSDNMYALLATAVLGVWAAAVLKVTQNLFAPAHVVMNAYQALALPMAARRREGGKGAVRRFVLGSGLLVFLPLGAYWLLVSLFAGRLLGRLYGAEYAPYAGLLWLLCLDYSLFHFSQVASLGFIAVNRTRAMFLGRVASIGVIFSLGLPLISQFGIHGVFYGSIIATTLRLAILWWAWQRVPGEAHETTVDKEKTPPRREGSR